jgi:hypothetical protein
MAERAHTGAGPDRFTLRELVEEAQREAFMRRRVYPRQVEAGRMTQQDADRRIDLMEGIAARLKAAGR